MLWDLLALTGELGLLMWLAAALFWALAGAALASWLRRPVWLATLLGAVLLVLGPIVSLIIEGVERGRAGTLGRRAAQPRATWGRPGLREAVLAVPVLAAAGLVVVTGLHDTELRVGGGFRLLLAIRDVGLTTVTVVTVIVLVAGTVLSWHAPRRWVAVAVAWCAAWWLLWALGALLVGDTLRVLVHSTGVTDAFDAVIHVGRSWGMLLALAGVLVAWSAGMLVLVHRGVSAGSASAFPGTTTAELPAPRPAADPFAQAGRPAPLSGTDPFAGPDRDPFGRPSDPFGRPADPFSGGR